MRAKTLPVGPSPSGRESRARSIAEGILLAVACLAPWAFGSVDAWAEFGLYAAIGVAVILTVVADRSGPLIAWRTRLLSLPSLALGGLALLAMLHATPLGEGWLGVLAPGKAALRAELLPESPEHVVGDEAEPPVPFPPATLSLDPDASWQVAARLTGAWLLFQAVLGLGGGYAPLRRFGLAITANATLLSLFSLIQALTWNGKIFWVRPSPHLRPWSGGGPFVSHSHLAEYLNFGLGFALAFFLTTDRLLDPTRLRRGRNLWAAYAGGAILLGIVTSNSRGGFLAMLGAFAVTLMMMRVKLGRAAAATVAMLGILGLYLYVLGEASPYTKRLASIWSSDEGYSTRTEIWAGALRAWRDYPVWGTGLGSFGIATLPYHRIDHKLFFTRAENQYIDLLAESGLVGFGLALTLLAGIVHLTRQALRAEPPPADRLLLLGGVFGGIAMALHSLSDFGLHIPGVSVPLVILCAHLSRLGLAARTPAGASRPVEAPRRLPAKVWVPSLLASGVLVVGLLEHGSRNVLVEGIVLDAGLPAPGTSLPAVVDLDLNTDQLDRLRTALEEALTIRPNWSEGFLRLGTVQLGLYQRMAESWLQDATDDPRLKPAADPLWLLGLVHENLGADGAVTGDSLREFDPVRMHLIPATYCFLEGRSRCVVAGLAHARLAGLHFLLSDGDPPATYAARALRLAGSDASLSSYVALVAVEIGDLDLAARAWRHALIAREADWKLVADLAAQVLTADKILESVVPNGRLAFAFAGRLYADPADAETRRRFLEAAAERIPSDEDISPAERLQVEGRILAALDRRDDAVDRFREALDLQPDQGAWRKELIDWLLAWGRLEQADDEARLWLYLSPGNTEARATLEKVADAIARGGMSRS